MPPIRLIAGTSDRNDRKPYAQDPFRRIALGSKRVCASIEGDLSLTPPGDVVDDELHEVLITIANDDILDGVGGRFPRLCRLPSGSVAFQARP